MNDAQQKIRPGRVWYVIGVVLFFIGTVGGPGWFIVTLVSDLTSGKYFLAPGTQTYTLECPGKYVLWHAAKTLFQGKSYSFPPELPHGVIIKVLNNNTQEELTVEPSLGATESSGNQKKYSICSFRVETPGEYTVEISNLPSNQVFMLRKSLTKHVLLTLLQSGIIGMTGGIGGFVLVILVAVRRHKAEKKLDN
jgi:hypothetical protein